jgi:hypothetical protein
MHVIKHITVTLIVIIAGVMVGCAGNMVMAVAKGVSASGPLPPNAPRSIDSFNVKFVPSTDIKYPPTITRPVIRYKNILHWPGAEDLVRGNEGPKRTYVVIGQLYFGEDWYFEQNIDDLVAKFVPQYGGDAVLKYEAFQTKAALVTNQNTKTKMNVYYQSIEMDVIRFIDSK